LGSIYAFFADLLPYSNTALSNFSSVHDHKSNSLWETHKFCLTKCILVQQKVFLPNKQHDYSKIEY